MALDLSYLSFRNNWSLKKNQYKNPTESLKTKITLTPPNWKNNYFPEKYLVRNPFTQLFELAHPEDQRENWQKNGKLLGPGAVKLKKPDTNEYEILIPCYTFAFNKSNDTLSCLTKPDGDKVVSLYNKDQYKKLSLLFENAAVYPAQKESKSETNRLIKSKQLRKKKENKIFLTYRDRI